MVRARNTLKLKFSKIYSKFLFGVVKNSPRKIN